jgi:hypothetical protein
MQDDALSAINRQYCNLFQIIIFAESKKKPRPLRRGFLEIIYQTAS